MTIGNETHESIKNMRLREKIEVVQSFGGLVQLLMKGFGDIDSKNIDYEEDDDFTQFEKNHEEAMKNSRTSI